jgi:hypothetical protein
MKQNKRIAELRRNWAKLADTSELPSACRNVLEDSGLNVKAGVRAGTPPPYRDYCVVV